MTNKQSSHQQETLPLYILSGGVGASGEQITRTVLAQFPEADVKIEIFPKVFTEHRVEQILCKAVEQGAIVAHTFVDPKLRRFTRQHAEEMDVVAVDLVDSLIQTLAEKLERKPLGKPGLYRHLYRSYFARIDAMDYALAHDDGQKPHEWNQAEIILLGPSRVGKTPLSLYLSVMGWRAANVPLIPGVDPHPHLFKVDQPQLIGLTMAPCDLIEHRKHRQSRLGLSEEHADYVDPVKVYEEVDAIEKLLKRHKVPLIDVTGKPIETSADQIIRMVRRKIKI